MKFFVLDRHPKPDQVLGVTDFHLRNPVRGEAPRCPVCGGYTGGLPLLQPVRVDLEVWGTQFGEFAFGPGDQLLVTEHLWALFRGSDLTGLLDVGPAEVIGVKAHKKLGLPLPCYRCCRVARSRAAIDEAKSGLEREPAQRCEACRLGGIIKRAKRIVLEPDSWSGEDIFFARGLPGTILASEKFQDFCVKNHVSNCVLIPAEKYSFDFYWWEKGGKSWRG